MSVVAFRLRLTLCEWQKATTAKMEQSEIERVRNIGKSSVIVMETQTFQTDLVTQKKAHESAKTVGLSLKETS